MKRISFEFFPPKTEQGKEKLLATQKNLLVKNPEFFSCTFGAGGSTRDNTRDTRDSTRESGSMFDLRAAGYLRARTGTHTRGAPTGLAIHSVYFLARRSRRRV